MQALYDFLPIIAFFTTFKFAGIYWATGVLMAVTVAVAAIQWFERRTISPMLMISASLALVFGGLTLYFHNQLFIMWKPTIVDGLFAGILLASQFLSGGPVIKKIMGHVLKTDDRRWRIANASLALFFLASGAINLVFVYGFSVDAWNNWKLANYGVMVVFIMGVSFWLASRAEPVEPAER